VFNLTVCAPAFSRLRTTSNNRNLRHSEAADFDIGTIAPFQKPWWLACEAGSSWRTRRDNITRPQSRDAPNRSPFKIALLDPFDRGGYILGPAFIEYDRQTDLLTHKPDEQKIPII